MLGSKMILQIGPLLHLGPVITLVPLVFEQAFVLVPTFLERNPQSTCFAASFLAEHVGFSLDCDRSMT